MAWDSRDPDTIPLGRSDEIIPGHGPSGRRLVGLPGDQANFLIDVMRDGRVIKKTRFYWPNESQKLWMRLGDLEEFLSADDFVRLKELPIQLFGDLIDVDLYFLTFSITILPGQMESLERVANWVTDRMAAVR